MYVCVCVCERETETETETETRFSLLYIKRGRKKKAKQADRQPHRQIEGRTDRQNELKVKEREEPSRKKLSPLPFGGKTHAKFDFKFLPS